MKKEYYSLRSRSAHEGTVWQRVKCLKEALWRCSTGLFAFTCSLYAPPKNPDTSTYSPALLTCSFRSKIELFFCARKSDFHKPTILPAEIFMEIFFPRLQLWLFMPNAFVLISHWWLEELEMFAEPSVQIIYLDAAVLNWMWYLEFLHELNVQSSPLFTYCFLMSVADSAWRAKMKILFV